MCFDSQEAGIAVILRNSMGEVIMAATIKENMVQQLKIIEFLAILRGLQLCLHLGFQNLIIESDYQLMVNEP